MRNLFYAVLFAVVYFLATGCTEKDDFIPEPTPTSVIVSGKVTTTSGKPLANIPIYIDYKRMAWLGPQNTLHKAKTKTDSNGSYRLFFELEKMSGSESGVLEGYYLYADLNALSSKEYIKPNDFDENSKDIYCYVIYKELAQGENLEFNLHFPKKKEVIAKCRNFIADQSLNIRNSIVYGVDYESLSRTLELDLNGNGNGNIPCAAEETNFLTVFSTLNIPEEIESKKIVFDNNNENKIVFDNNELLKNCSFKLSLYDYFSFDGKPYEHKTIGSLPAPFDFLGFRILLPDGQYEAFGTQRYQYYDSIVWCSPEFPETFKVYEKKSYESSSQEHLVTQWGSHFFNTGFHKTILKGYKNGRIICSDSVSFELNDRDFLCFDWSNCNTVPKQDGMHKVYCQLDSFFEYKMSSPIEIDDTKALDIYIGFRDYWSEDVILNWQETRLNYMLWTHLGNRVDYDKSEVFNLFKLLSPDDLPGKLYENETTRAIVMHRLPGDDENPKKECFYIHVESK
ncbi:MAG: hypothetical protein K2G77_01125 [Muribaculaceae bacterium]|nr:hypothetical protein [Muribaculaceae bacterium]